MMVQRDKAVDRAVSELHAAVDAVLTDTQGHLLCTLVQAVVERLGERAEILPCIVEATVAAQKNVSGRILTNLDQAHREVMQKSIASTPPADVTNSMAIIQLVKSTFKNHEGLTAWIKGDTERHDVAMVLVEFQKHILERRSNACRSDFEQLLTVYMTALGIKPCSHDLRKMLTELQEFLLPSPSNGDTIKLLQRRHLLWGCERICNMDYDRSVHGYELTEPAQLELCASISAIARTIPAVANAIRIERGLGKNFVCIQSTSSKYEKWTTVRALHGNMTRGTWAGASNKDFPLLRPAGSLDTTRPTAHENSGPDSKANNDNPRGQDEAKVAPAETAAAHGLPMKYKLLYERPLDIPEWPLHLKIMYRRMLNHMKLVPRAKLCPLGPRTSCWREDCANSHSYFEVMTFNPLFKLLECGRMEHFWGHDVDKSSCVCLHVDFDIDRAWMQAKAKICLDGAQCVMNQCKKSHSFEEVCWYNPRYKTVKCVHEDRCNKGAACPYYHHDCGAARDKWDIRDEDDYVGKSVQMLFLSRTHTQLANALEAMRMNMELRDQESDRNTRAVEVRNQCTSPDVDTIADIDDADDA